MPNPENLVRGAGRDQLRDLARSDRPPALKGGWRSRRPPPEVLEPYKRRNEADVLLIGELEQSLAIDDLIADRLIDHLEQQGWTHRGKMRPEVEHLGKANDRRARRAEQLRRARLDALVADRAGIVPLTDAFAEIEEGDDEDA